MTVAYSCILVMIIFPYIFTILAKTGPNFNNRTPREYLEKVTGWRRRAHYIQLNSFEVTPAFAIAVVIAHLAHAPQPILDRFAVAFVFSRLIYAICYLCDKNLLRTLFWTIGMFCIFGIFYIAY